MVVVMGSSTSGTRARDELDVIHVTAGVEPHRRQRNHQAHVQDQEQALGVRHAEVHEVPEEPVNGAPQGEVEQHQLNDCDDSLQTHRQQQERIEDTQHVNRKTETNQELRPTNSERETEDPREAAEPTCGDGNGCLILAQEVVVEPIPLWWLCGPQADEAKGGQPENVRPRAHGEIGERSQEEWEKDSRQCWPCACGTLLLSATHTTGEDLILVLNNGEGTSSRHTANEGK